MVKRLLRFLHRETNGLHEAAYLLSFFALLSQALALARDRLFAHTFGAGETLDLYYAAFKIPDIIFVSVASLVSLSVLVPLLSEILERDDAAARRLVSEIFFVFFLVTTVAALLAFLFMPYLLRAAFPGFSDAVHQTSLVPLARLMLLQPILLGVSSLFSSITQLYRKFFVSALSPLLYNIGIILGIALFYPIFGIQGLGIGVVLGALLHMLVQTPFFISSGFFPHIPRRIQWSAIRRVVALSLPRTIALSAQQVSLLGLLALASFFREGSIAVFNFSYNLQAVPLTIVAVSYSTAAFPSLSRLMSQGKREEFGEEFIAALRHIIFWSLPALALLIVLRAQIVRVVLGTGAFDWGATRLTAATLALFSLSIAAQGVTLLFVRAYYAAGHTRKPVIINLASAVLVVLFAYGLSKLFTANILFRYFIEAFLDVEGVPGTSVLMLALGFSLAAIINAAVFWVVGERDIVPYRTRVLPMLAQSAAASLTIGFSSYFFLAILGNVLNLTTFGGIFFQGLIAGLGGILCGIAALMAFGSKELQEVKSSLHKKFWRARIIGPDPTV